MRRQPVDPERKRNILGNRHMRKKGISLKHHAKASGFGGPGGDVGFAFEEASGAGFDEACKTHQKGGFPGAGGPKQSQELALVDLNGHPVQGRSIAVGLADLHSTQQRLLQLRAPSGSP